MARLVDDLLVYARKGTLSLEHEPVDVSSIVRDAAEEFRSPRRGRGRLDLPSAPPRGSG